MRENFPVRAERQLSAVFSPAWLRPPLPLGARRLWPVLQAGIFAAYHFNNTAPLGLVGNVLALPAISILVMPFGVFGLVLMPLQLDWLPLQVMGVGLWAVRHIAAFVASWSPDGNPGAMPGPALVLWTMALLVAVAFTTRLKLLALPLLAAGLAVFSKCLSRILWCLKMRSSLSCASRMEALRSIAIALQNSPSIIGSRPI